MFSWIIAYIVIDLGKLLYHFIFSMEQRRKYKKIYNEVFFSPLVAEYRKNRTSRQEEIIKVGGSPRCKNSPCYYFAEFIEYCIVIAVSFTRFILNVLNMFFDFELLIQLFILC